MKLAAEEKAAKEAEETAKKLADEKARIEAETPKEEKTLNILQNLHKKGVKTFDQKLAQ